MTSSAPSISFATGGNSRELIDMLNQQRILYEAIHRLSTQQAGLVASADAEALLNLLSQRQHLVDRLAQINQKLEPYRQNWRSVYDALCPDDQLHVTQLVDHAQNALATIIAQDEADRKSLEDAKNAMGKEIKQVNKAGLAAAAYGAKPNRPNPQYTNHQG